MFDECPLPWGLVTKDTSPHRPDLQGDPLAPDWVPPTVDSTKAHPARIYDYLLGGKDNFPIDREAAETALRVVPEIRAMAREGRSFVGRAVRHLAQQGHTQFLDIGTGIPGPGHTGEMVLPVQPGARIVHVDYDPMVIAHARALLAGAAPGHVAVIQADVRQPKSILDDGEVRAVLDFDRPIVVVMAALLHFVADHEDPAGLVAEFASAVVPGSAFIISHATGAGDTERSQAAQKGWDQSRSPLTVRTTEQIRALFGDLEIAEPGVVRLAEWFPDGSPVQEPGSISWPEGAVAYKR
jgi:hypothetical protein